MKGALLILAVTVLTGFVLWAWERARARRHGNTLHHHGEPGESGSEAQSPTEAPAADKAAAVCCGLHAICEKTGQVNEPPVYYDDEELDRFAGRHADGYSDAETEEFRDVLLTLMPQDAPGWAVSLEKRRIALPEALVPELELLLMEQTSTAK